LTKEEREKLTMAVLEENKTAIRFFDCSGIRPNS
jgi:hypothetical protein